MSASDLSGYGMSQVGEFCIANDQFVMTISAPELLEKQRTVYALTINDKIVRVGSSKAKLKVRFRAWQRDVSAALQGRKSSTSIVEAAKWREVLGNRVGLIYAREGALVTTPIGEISAYLAEEIALIERYLPLFCRR